MEEAQAVRVLKALADERRFRMVQTIAAAGELSCGELGAHFDLSKKALRTCISRSGAERGAPSGCQG